MFLQQYVWAANTVRQGYGPYYATSSWIETVVVVAVIVDLIILRWTIRGSRGDRLVPLVWSAAFLGLNLVMLVANYA